MKKISISINPELEQMTVWDILVHQASVRAEQLALLSAAEPNLTYAQLLQRMLAYKLRFQQAGLTSADRIAIVLPNGLMLAEALLAVLSHACCAPLNPAYHQDDYEFYFRDLGVKAVILDDNDHSPAREVAIKMGLIILTPLSNDDTSTYAEDALLFKESSRPVSGDVALLLHTSGTTSRPKLVPLTQKNILTSMHNISNTLQLSDQDCSLNMMPLFHIHAIIGSLLATLYTGGRVICANGFQQHEFFNWLQAEIPTWYSAVPTIHQSILINAKNRPDILKSHMLRFIRSSSAALLPQVRTKIEETFKVPVIEAYGMTEGAQLTSDPLPPLQVKKGSVGLAAGPEVAVMDDQGQLLASGAIGEIVIRGANVMSGYEHNQDVNQASFTNGWFRTGDQGWMDDDGYIFLTDRLKEIINRGGEKISPREIDEVLMDHDDIIQAVTFAVAHPNLGEDIGAVVVLKPESTTTTSILRAYLFTRLPDFKVPSQIIILPEIPKGYTGKLQRIGLAEKLAGLHQQAYEAPVNPIEKLLATHWCEILGIERIGIHDNFFFLGGHSLTATQAITHVNRELGISLPLRALFEHPSIHELESEITQIQSSTKSEPVLTIKPRSRDAYTSLQQ